MSGEGCHGNEAMGIYAGGGGGRRKKGGEWDFHLKSNNPSLRGGEQIKIKILVRK